MLLQTEIRTYSVASWKPVSPAIKVFFLHFTKKTPYQTKKVPQQMVFLIGHLIISAKSVMCKT